MGPVDIIGLLFAFFVICGGILLLAILVYDLVAGTHYSCDILGWHNGRAGIQRFDGCSIHAACSKCGKEVMQDSKGNWFEIQS